MDLKPISRIILQSADGTTFYSIPWDAGAAIEIRRGIGAGTVVHGSSSYVIHSSAFAPPPDVSTDAPYQQDAPYNPDAPPSPDAT